MPHRQASDEGVHSCFFRRIANGAVEKEEGKVANSGRSFTPYPSRLLTQTSQCRQSVPLMGPGGLSERQSQAHHSSQGQQPHADQRACTQGTPETVQVPQPLFST